MAMTFFTPLLDLSKLEPLDGTNYKRWSQKMLIFFEQLNVDYVLLEAAPVPLPDAAVTAPDAVTDAGAGKELADKALADDLEKRKKYETDNKTVRGHLLSHVSNPIFDLLTIQKSAKTNYVGSLCSSRWWTANLSCLKSMSTRTWLLIFSLRA